MLDPQNDRIYAVDTVQHRLLILTETGQFLKSTRHDGVLLCYPNGITLDAAGNPTVADTSNLRVVQFLNPGSNLDLTSHNLINFFKSPRPQIQCIIGKNLSKNIFITAWNNLTSTDINYRLKGNVQGLDMADEGRAFPKFVEQDRRGFWWVVIGDRSMNRDNVLRFDSNWKNPEKIEMLNSAYISNMGIGNNHVFLTYPDEYQIRSINIEDLSVQIFGDEKTQKLWEDEKKEKVRLQRSYSENIHFFVAGAFCLVFLSMRQDIKKRRWIFPRLIRLSFSNLSGNFDKTLTPNPLVTPNPSFKMLGQMGEKRTNP